MPEKTLVDAVMQRLDDARATTPQGAERGSAQKQIAPARRIDVRDLDAIAERHHAEGRDEGWRDGYARGSAFGLARGRHEGVEQSRVVLRASLNAVTARLENMGDVLAVPLGRDEERKKDLRLRAIGLVDELIAGIGTLMAAHAEGRFEQGAEEKF